MTKLGTGLICLITACGPGKADGSTDGNINPDGGMCTQGATRCSEIGLEVCGEFGGWSHEPDANGICSVSCDTGEGSYIGCVYFATQSANPLLKSFCDAGVPLEDCFSFAITVSNANATPASVQITGGDLEQDIALEIAPNAVAVRRLPWVSRLPTDAVSGTSLVAPSVDVDGRTTADGRSQLVEDGAFVVTSDIPITVYQFNPLDYVRGQGDDAIYSSTNDASLLFPANAQSGRYVISSYPGFVYSDSETANLAAASNFTVTGTLDNTTVTVTPTTPIIAGTFPAMPAGTPSSFTINRGDVVQLGSPTADLTGTLVQTNKPVQVLSGHGCTGLPSSPGGAWPCCCDHIEESAIPFQALGGDYIISAPLLSDSNGTYPRDRVVRIVAADGPTSLSFEPPLTDIPTQLTHTGDYIDIGPLSSNHRVRATAKIVVTEYMVSQNYGGDGDTRAGDPAMTSAVPVDQFRASYHFHAPINYEDNFVSIVALGGTSVTLDGVAVTTWEDVGQSGYVLARVRLGDGNGGDGNHNIEGSASFGISVYGYGRYTSYWYPGGLDLKDIEVVID